MQQPPQLMNITTEHIQKYLDKNKELIMAIMENQNQGKLTESTSFQAQLQQNLLYLAKIADAQSQASTTSQVMQQEQHVQSAQASTAKEHPGLLAPKFPFHSTDQQQLIYLQQQQLNQSQVRLRSGGPSDSYQGVQTEFGNTFMNTQDDAVEEFRNSAFGQRYGE